MDLYIYYRVPVADAAIFLEKVSEMQAMLVRSHGVCPALKRRPLEQDGMHTWMEVYLGVAEDFEAVLEQAIVDHQLPPFINGKRHMEQFLDVSLCV